MTKQKFLWLAAWLMLGIFTSTSFAQDLSEKYGDKQPVDAGDVRMIPCPTNAPIAFEQTVNGTLATGDCVNAGRIADEYRFVGRAGQQIVITMDSDALGNGSSGVDSAIRLFRQDGSQIAIDDDGNTSGSSTVVRNARVPALTGFFTLPADETYYIHATTLFGPQTGTYSLTLIDGGIPPCTTAFLENTLAPNNVVNGDLSLTDCVRRGQFYTDLYAITGRGQSVTFDLASSQFDAFLILRSGGVDGTIVAQNNDGGGGTNSRITATLVAGTTYFLEVSSALSNQRGSYSLTYTTNLATGTIPVSIGNINATRGTSIQVPIIVGALPANTIRSFEFSLSFDPSILRVGGTPGASQGSPISQTGTISGTSSNGTAFMCETNVQTSGQVRVACFSPNNGFLNPGAGTLINLNFDVIGNNGTSSPLSLIFRFNEDNPLSFVFGGGVLVNQFSISGNVLYGLFPNGSSGANLDKPVANVNLTAFGNPVVASATNLRGAYSLNGLGSGSYNVVPSKFGDVLPGGGVISPQVAPPISAFDASIAARIAVGNAVNPTNGVATQIVSPNLPGGNVGTNQQRAADVSNNLQITAFDAALISAFVVSSTPPSGNRTGSWDFNGTNRVFSSLTASLTNINFEAILIGDPSGNWVQPCVPSASVICPTSGGASELTAKRTNAADAISVTLPLLRANQNQTITVPISVSELSNKGAYSYDFDLRFNPNVLRLTSNPLSKDGTVSNNYAVVHNAEQPGRLRVAAYGTQPLQGNGTLINVNFEVIGNSGSNSDLSWSLFFFNEGEPQSASSNGRILVGGTPGMFDFDADGKADLSVYRNGEWYVQRSSQGFMGLNWGLATDQMAPADYDGDGKTDVAVFRGDGNGNPDKGVFYIINSFNGTVNVAQFGRQGDTVISGDYDNDGKADMAVYRNGANANDQSYFYYRPSTAPGVDFRSIAFGIKGDVPVVGDYDGDRVMDVAVFRPSDRTWYIRPSSTGVMCTLQFGLATDKLVPADYDGDGLTDIAVMRDGDWYIMGSQIGFKGLNFGLAGDVPVVADYDGDRKADVAVFRSGVWYWLKSNSNNSVGATQFGSQNDKPVPNSYIQ